MGECLDTSTPSGGPPNFKQARRQQPVRSQHLVVEGRPDHQPSDNFTPIKVFYLRTSWVSMCTLVKAILRLRQLGNLVDLS
jgi:hypothetical protein